MRPKQLRLLLCLGSSAVFLLAGWLAIEAWQKPRGAGRVQFFEPEPGPVLPSPANPIPARTNWLDPLRPEDWKWFVSERDAGRLFAIGPQFGARFDPWTHLVREPGQETRIDCPQLPGGELRWTTNSLGLREPRELSDPPAALRVLVAGDSHTFGFCADDESFANRLEVDARGSASAKDRRGARRRRAVLEPDRFQGTLHKFRSFAAQVFVVGVYAGNDFGELGVLRTWFSQELQRPLTPEYSEARRRARKAAPEAMAQCYGSIARFHGHPEERSELVGMAVDLCSEMQAICRLRGTAMIVVVLPAACDCAWPEPHPEIESARVALSISAEDERLNAQLAETFLLGLAAAGIDAIDMRPIFLAQPEPPYWRTDLHLNPTGHRLVAERLFPEVQARLR